MQEMKIRREKILSMFRGGKSKSEIARELGCSKDEVKRDLAIAIREAGEAARRGTP